MLHRLMLLLLSHLSHYTALAMALWQRPNGPQSIAAQSSTQAGLNVQGAVAGLIPVTFAVTSAVEAVVPHPQNPAVPYILSLSPNQQLEQIPFDIELSGYLQTTSTTNVTLKIYSGTSFTIGSDILLATSGAIAQNSSLAPFEIHLHAIYDSVSGKLGGYFEGFINNTLIAKTALSTVLTGLKDTNNPVMNLVASLTSSAAAGGTPTTVVIRNFTAG